MTRSDWGWSKSMFVGADRKAVDTAKLLFEAQTTGDNHAKQNATYRSQMVELEQELVVEGRRPTLTISFQDRLDDLAAGLGDLRVYQGGDGYGRVRLAEGVGFQGP